MVKRGARWLVISDLQIPYESPKALQFCRDLARELGVPINSTDLRVGGICNVGDEVDHYFGSRFDKDPDALHTPRGEIRETREKIAQWAAAFPQMWLANSNHGRRWNDRGKAAGMPRELRRPYQRVIQAPKTWKWADQWIIRSRHPWRFKHGLGYGSMYAYRHLALDGGISTAFGHLHSSAGIAHLMTDGLNRWGMNVGCLINADSYAFAYGKDSKWKPCLAVGAVVDDGLTPLLFRLEV